MQAKKRVNKPWRVVTRRGVLAVTLRDGNLGFDLPVSKPGAETGLGHYQISPEWPKCNEKIILLTLQQLYYE